MSMPEAPLTNREIQLMFENIKEGIKSLKEDIRQNNTYVEKRFKIIEDDIKVIRDDVEDLKQFKTRTLAYWSIGVTAVTVLINRLF